MAIFDAVLITMVLCAVVCAGWYRFERRSHRGGHARYGAAYSPYVVAERVRTERRRADAAGRHHRREDSEPESRAFLSGELPLLSGYTFETGDRT